MRKRMKIYRESDNFVLSHKLVQQGVQAATLCLLPGELDRHQAGELRVRVCERVRAVA